MAEEKKTVGRPKKVENQPVIDEKQEVLMMTDHSDNQNNFISMRDLEESYINVMKKFAYGTSTSRGASQLINAFTTDLENPFIQNARLKRLYTIPSEYDKGNVLEAIKDPGNYEIMLRSIVGSLSSSNYLYYKILREATDIPLFKHYIIPPDLDKSSEYNGNDFKNEFKLVESWVKEFDVVNTFKRIALEVKRGGKEAYIFRNSFGEDEKGKKKVNYAYLQKLPSDYIKVTYLGKMGYGVSFNLMWLLTPGTSPSQFNEYIQDVWRQMNENGIINTTARNGKSKINLKLATQFKPKYKNQEVDLLLEKNGDGRYLYWLMLPQEMCFVFSSDTSTPYQAPDTAGLITDLQNLTSFTDVSALLSTTPLTSFLTAEVEPVNNAQAGRCQTIISADLLDSLNEEFDSRVSESVMSFFAPLKNFQLHNLSSSNVNSSEVLSTATQNFLTRAGVSGTIPSTDKPSVFQIKVATKELASQYDFVTRQFEKAMNFMLKELLGFKYEWSIRIFGDIFSIEEERGFLKESVAGGSMFFLPKLLACEDISMTDAQGIVNYLESSGIYKKLVTPTMYKQNELAIKTAEAGAQENKDEMANGTTKVGRPTKPNTDSDSTENSKDSGDNIGEIKNEYK